MKFSREALPFVLPVLLTAIVIGLFGYPRAAWLTGGLALLVLLFFRIPSRSPNLERECVVSPACGKVLRVDTTEEPLLGPGQFQRIVTFLSVFDVHVQRSPFHGAVAASHFRPGRKVAAFRADAGEVNESHLIVLRLEDGRLMGVRQIAGLVARRVVSYPKVGDSLDRGDLIGLIKFGSRVDLLLPDGFEIIVSKGQRLREGETVVARDERTIASAEPGQEVPHERAIPDSRS